MTKEEKVNEVKQILAVVLATIEDALENSPDSQKFLELSPMFMIRSTLEMVQLASALQDVISDKDMNTIRTGTPDEAFDVIQNAIGQKINQELESIQGSIESTNDQTEIELPSNVVKFKVKGNNEVH